MSKKELNKFFHIKEINSRISILLIWIIGIIDNSEILWIK